MQQCEICMHGVPAGILEVPDSGAAVFRYHDHYEGPPVSVTLPLEEKLYQFSGFPSFFDGLLPEGSNLAMLLAQHSLDAKDRLSQLTAIGENLSGAVTVREYKP